MDITSYNPSRDFEPVFSIPIVPDQVEKAISKAQKARLPWATLSDERRIHFLLQLKQAFIRREQDIATAISKEMGKAFHESLTEAKSLSARIDLVIQHGLSRVATEYPKGVAGETRYHAQGILAVLGPYNFPAHLINAHVIPALLTGNVVIVKPSEVCPWVGQIYNECVLEADLPPGVFNLVQGDGHVGRELSLHPLIHGVLFTGSYQTGRAIAASLLDQPHKILALEMGGKNIAVVLQDADIKQAVSEIIQGAYLTTGQRCTATSRVLVARQVADTFISAFVEIAKQLKPGDPFVPETVFGPLASEIAFERYHAIMANLAHPMLEVLVGHNVVSGGAFVMPSVYFLKERVAIPGYLDAELFGPNVCIEIIDDLDNGIARVNESPYGLSNAIFTEDKSNFERFYFSTRSGVLNWNRSTNGASGQQPFGGIGKSGNQRAAGIDAVRYTTYPVAINMLKYGETQPIPQLKFLIDSIKPMPSHFKLLTLTMANWHQYEPTIAKLEEEAYEPGRRDDMEYLRSWLKLDGGIGIALIDARDGALVGLTIGGPLECSQVDGPKQDEMRGKNNTFYSTNLMISAKYRGLGLGMLLKKRQIEQVLAYQNADKSPRYYFMTGRNRVGHAAQMTRINEHLGAKTVAIYDNQYGEKDAQALYYRITLRS